MTLCLTGTPIDVTVYDIHRISIKPEHSQPITVRATVAYKGNSKLNKINLIIFIIFLVNTSQAGQGQLKVELIQPQTSKILCRCHIQEINSHEYRIQYIPTEPGRYQLRILFNNQLVQGKTFDTDVYFSLPQNSSSMVRIQQISPNTMSQIGDDICLQSKQYFFL
jgi:hypothetical protein